MSVKRRIGAALSGFVDAFQPAWQYQQYLDRLGATEERAEESDSEQRFMRALTETSRRIPELTKSRATPEQWKTASEQTPQMFDVTPEQQEVLRGRIMAAMPSMGTRGLWGAEAVGPGLVDVSPARRDQALEQMGVQPIYAGFDPAPLLDLPLEVREGLPVTGEYQVDQYHPEAVESFKTAQQEAVSLQEAVENRDRRLAADRLMLQGQTGTQNLVLPDGTPVTVILSPNVDDPQAGAIVTNVVPWQQGVGPSPFQLGQPPTDIVSQMVPLFGGADIDENMLSIIGALQRAPGYTPPAWTGDMPFELQFEPGRTTWPELLGQFELPSPEAAAPSVDVEEDILGLPAEPEVVEWDPSDPAKSMIDVKVLSLGRFELPRKNPLTGEAWRGGRLQPEEGWPTISIPGAGVDRPTYTPGTYPGPVVVTYDELAVLERFVIETQIAEQEENLALAKEAVEASQGRDRRPLTQQSEAESHLAQLHRHLAGLPEAPAVFQTPEPIPGAGAPYSPPILSSGTLVPRPDPGSFQLPLRSFGNLVPAPTPEIGSLQLPLQSFGDLVPAPTPNVGSLQIPSDRLRSFGNLIPALQPDPGSLQLPIRSSGDLVTLPDPGSLQIPPLSVRRREASTPVSPPVTFDAERFRPVSPPGTFDQFGDSWSQFPDQPPRSEMEREPPAITSRREMEAAAVREAQEHGIPVEAFLGMIAGESSWNPAAEDVAQGRWKGGGLGQIALPTAQGEGFTGTEEELKDPATNLRYSAKYLARLFNQFDGDMGLALAAYNAGPDDATWWSKNGGLRPGNNPPGKGDAFTLRVWRHVQKMRRLSGQPDAPYWGPGVRYG